MGNVRIDMEYKVISYSFVMIWANPIPFIPTLEQGFAKKLFGKPDETAYSFNNDGINISLHPIRRMSMSDTASTITVPPGVYPEVIFHPQFYANFNSELNHVLNIHNALMIEFNRIDQTFLKSLTVSQIGVNIEVEVDLGKDFDSTTWTKAQLFENESTTLSRFSFNEYKFTLEEDFSKRLTVALQPRFDNKNALYMSVNHHYGVSPIDSFSSVNSMRELVDLSLAKIDTLIHTTLSNIKR